MEQAINIEQLLSKGHYKIPLYQRNFAWEKEEIQQLLEDILTSNINSNYYLGTLVLSDFNGSYEIIDGQQRFTVLHLINAYLNDHYENLTKKTNIYFEARPNIQRLLSDLAENNCDEIDIDKYLNVKGEGINAIMEGLQSIKDFFSTKTKEDKDAFKERFYKEVNIFEIFLPQNTNLNHYFEVMNNRGEQLEKHEILKAKFIGNIDTNTSEEKGKKEIQKAIFSQIWDACADMNSHVKANFPKKMSKKLFNDDIEGFPTKDAVLKNDIFTNSNNEHENKESTITQIIEDYNLPEEFNQEKKEDPPERFKSIINFSNFLLQFLKLYQTERDISLDDKFLLKEFCYPDNLSDSINFIVNLLRYRVLFDEYIIKREGEEKDWDWSINKIYKTNDGDFDYKETFNNEKERDLIKMIQSMFHVTFPTNTYKTWLFKTIKFIWNNQNEGKLVGTDLLNYLEKYAVNYYTDKINGHTFNDGLSTPRFLFNYLDYLLWKKYYEEIRGSKHSQFEQTYKKIINNQRNKFSAFKFVQRSTIEHFFPQARIEEITGETTEEKKNTLNSFGNLCLISRSDNSFFNKSRPEEKKRDAAKKETTSLKQLIMFGMIDIYGKWNKEEICKHADEMRSIIKNEINQIYIYDFPNQ